MKAFVRVMLLAAVVSALAVPASALGPEGCTNLPGQTCTYKATVAGSIAAVGDWKVEVWWDGVCGAGLPDYTRGSAPHTAHPASPTGDNNAPGGVAGTWEGSVAPGACALVTTGDGIALVGNVELSY